MSRRQQPVIEYLQEEVSVLQEQLSRIPHFTDDQRRNLAAKGQSVGRKHTIKESCLDTMTMFGESSCREAVFQFVEHYHQQRNHRTLENQIIRPEFAEFPAEGSVNRRKRLGGLLR